VSNEVLETPVVRMNENGYAGWQQLRTSGGNRKSRTIFQAKSKRNKLAIPLQVIQFGLGDGRVALGAPDRRGFATISQALAIEIKKREL